MGGHQQPRAAKQRHEPSLDDLAEGLQGGLHVENLRLLLGMCLELASRAEEPLALYVLASVFGDLNSAWNGNAIPARKHASVVDELLPLLRQAVFAVRRQASAEESVAILNRLLASFLRLQRDGLIG